MKERIIKIKLVRYTGMQAEKHWMIKSITNAFSVEGWAKGTSFKPGDLVSDGDVKVWIDSSRTYEVTVTAG